MQAIPHPRQVNGVYAERQARFMSHPQPNNPLHGITLEQVVTRLVEHYGWCELSRRIDIRCFSSNPSVKSSLTFLRKTPWARDKVEALFIDLQRRSNPARS